MNRLSGRVVVISGSGGIGEACIRRFAREGAQVVIGDIDADNAQRVADEINASGGKAVYLPLDLAREDSVKALFHEVAARFGRLDVLHNNAADTRAQQMALDIRVHAIPTTTRDPAFEHTTPR